MVTPLLKKEGLDEDVFENFRPISNLCTISKIVERVYMMILIAHIKRSSNYNRFQSAYRRGQSTETALLKMLNDVYCAADNGSRTMLLQLNLSSAFDTLDTTTLLRRLRSTFGIWSSPKLGQLVLGASFPVSSGRPAAVFEHRLRVWTMESRKAPC